MYSKGEFLGWSSDWDLVFSLPWPQVQSLVRELRSHRLSGVANILKMIKILFYVFEDIQKHLRHHPNQSFDEMTLLSWRTHRASCNWFIFFTWPSALRLSRTLPVDWEWFWNLNPRDSTEICSAWGKKKLRDICWETSVEWQPTS